MFIFLKLFRQKVSLYWKEKGGKMMGRKRITELFPWLLPFRKWERKLFFYGNMRLDANTYSWRKSEERLRYLCYRWESVIINPDTGHDIKFQINKEHNLRLACETLDGLVIRPGETFSFWQRVRYAEQKEAYRDGLSQVNGNIVYTRGGGLCQLSNELFWCFLHTPLTIVERHSHGVQEFPAAFRRKPVGTDAVVSEGWLDLKMRNDTSTTYQIIAEVCDGILITEIWCDRPVVDKYEIFARDVRYVSKNGEVLQYAKLYRRIWDVRRAEIPRAEHWLYENRTKIGYELPKDCIVEEMKG